MLKLSNQTNNSLKGVYDVEKRMIELEKAIADNDMNDVFTVASEMELDPATSDYKPTATATKLNLFIDFHKVDLDTVKQYNAYIMLYGPSYMVQNLTWGSEKILNSCNAELKAKITENIYKLPVEQRGQS